MSENMDALPLEGEIRELSEQELLQVDGGADKKQKYVWYTVKRGDTLIRIANHFKTHYLIIKKLNPIIKDASFIRTGWELLVPDNRK